MAIYYIIYNTKTNTWLPVKRQRNATSVELTNKKPPRLFNTHAAAKNALRWWKEGEWYNYAYKTLDYGDYDIDIKVTHKERDTENCVVLKIATHILYGE